MCGALAFSREINVFARNINLNIHCFAPFNFVIDYSRDSVVIIFSWLLLQLWTVLMV
jgi:hypothetical protein